MFKVIARRDISGDCDVFGAARGHFARRGARGARALVVEAPSRGGTGLIARSFESPGFQHHVLEVRTGAH